jgi:hypothetical protein
MQCLAKFIAYHLKGFQKLFGGGAQPRPQTTHICSGVHHCCQIEKKILSLSSNISILFPVDELL